MRVETCRCGLERPPIDASIVLPSEGAAAPASDEPASASGHGARLLLAGLLAGLIIAALGFSFLQPEPAPTKAPADRAARPDPAVVANGRAEGSVGESEGTDVAEPASVEPRSETTGPDEEVAQASTRSLEDVVARVLPAVASIQAGSGRGTGFFVRSDSLLTNAHVVGNESSVRVQTGAKQYQGRVIRLSPGTDLALIQVYDADPRQPYLTLGSGRSVRAGQEVIAVGFALGVLSNTVTRGIVSALRTTPSVLLIQTDAAINPGNSGGPLVDRDGTVVGVNSMRVNGAQGSEGLAFAVAIDHGTELLQGNATLTAVATPAQDLNRIMNGSSETSELRERGEAEYRRTLEQAVRSAAQIDSYWDRYSKSCLVSAARVGDRVWFAVYEPNGVRIAATSVYNCETWLGEVRTAAEHIKTALVAAAETGRRHGVYPGVMRDLRRQHRLEWAGWER
jgi:S1-C subfamily serine protease